MATYRWTTAKGAQIILDHTVAVEAYTEEIDADGIAVPVTKTRQVRSTLIAVDGKTYPATIGRANQAGKSLPAVNFEIGGHPAAAFIPEDICRELFAPAQDEIEAAKAEAKHEAFTRRWEAGYGDARANVRR
jgi:hypothetical protein